MRTRLFLAVALAATLATAARAEFISGNELLARSNGTPSEKLFAQGYVVGVHDVAEGLTHCSPSTVTIGQLLDMARKRLEYSPEIRDQSADRILLQLYAAAWPCPKKAPTAARPNT